MDSTSGGSQENKPRFQECRCLQTCSQLPGSLQRSLKPQSISSLLNHTPLAQAEYLLGDSCKGLPSRQKWCRSWQFYCAVLGLSVVILFLILRWLFVPEKNYFFSAVLETWCGISLGMFVGRVKDCICEKGSLIFHLHKCCDFYSTFLIRWCESLQPRYGLLCRCGTWIVLPNFDLDRMDLFLRHPRTDSLTVSVRWCAELNRLCDVAQNEAEFFSVLHQTHTYGENRHLLQYENASCEYKKACGQGSKQFFLNAGQQKSIVWQLWKVLNFLKFVFFFHY